MKKILDNFDLCISSILLVFMACVMIYEVIMRYIFHNASAVNTELCQLAFIWFIYLSMSHMTGKRAQITVEIADVVFPKHILKYIILLADLVMLLFTGIMAWYGVKLLFSVVEFPFVTPVLGINMIYPYSIIPLAFGVMTIKMLILIREDIAAIGKEGYHA